MEPGSDKNHLQCNKCFRVYLVQWQQHKLRKFLCFFWIRVQPGGEHCVGLMCCILQEKLWPQDTQPLYNSITQFPEKGVSGCLPPILSIPCESSESLKPHWSGTHEASPATVSHCQVKCTQDDGAAVRSRNALLQDALSSADSRGPGCIQLESEHCWGARTLRVVPCLLLPAESLQPPRSAGSQPQIWNASVCLHTKVWWAASGHKPGFPSAYQPHFDLT